MDPQIAKLAKDIGVSRLANVTGLDRIGLPVVAAVRPLSRNITVSFGKGKTLEGARISALMEAAELYFSESCRQPQVYATYLELENRLALNPVQLTAKGSPSDVLHRKFNWVSGFNLKSGRLVLVPWEFISMDYSTVARKPERPLAFGPTGLAAAFDEPRAILHGLYEVIERDCHASWNAISDSAREATLVDLQSISDDDTLRLLDALKSGLLDVLVWDMTGDLGVPCYLAEIFDLDALTHTRYAHGAAADISPHLAIYRALCEAAQVRLTYISGSRDDLDHDDYGNQFDEMVANRKWVLENLVPMVKVSSSVENDSGANKTLDSVCERLEDSGFEDIIVVRLSGADDQVAVVKVIVPALKDLRDLEPQKPAEQLVEDVFA